MAATLTELFRPSPKLTALYGSYQIRVYASEGAPLPFPKQGWQQELSDCVQHFFMNVAQASAEAGRQYLVLAENGAWRADVEETLQMYLGLIGDHRRGKEISRQLCKELSDHIGDGHYTGWAGFVQSNDRIIMSVEMQSLQQQPITTNRTPRWMQDA